MEKKEVIKKTPIGVKLIAIFYFLMTIFYFIFGAIASQILFLFGSIMSGNPLYTSNAVLNGASEISKEILDVSFPILSLILQSTDFSVGILAILSSAVFVLVGIGLLKRQNWARVFAILFSLEELGLAVYLLAKGELFGAILHFVFHAVIILYLIFNKNVKVQFK